MTQDVKNNIHIRICRIGLLRIMIIFVFVHQKNYLLHSAQANGQSAEGGQMGSGLCYRLPNNLSGVLKQEMNSSWAKEQNMMPCFQLDDLGLPDDSSKVCGDEKVHFGGLSEFDGLPCRQQAA